MDDSDIRILAVGTALPGPAVDNATLSRRFNMGLAWEQWIDTFVGTRARHFAFDLDTGKFYRMFLNLMSAATPVR